ncbi:MAG: hypothetical protein UHM08_08980 [Bacteroidales bacterium]|nr:hypothetical protein [Bacteroidales bacterium]
MGDINVVCSNCGYVSNYIFIGRAVHNTVNVDEKEFNKKLEKAKTDISRRG